MKQRKPTVANRNVAVSMTTETRRAFVAEMVAAGNSPMAIRSEMIARKIVNPRTGKGYSKQTIQSDITQVTKPTDVKFINGFRVYSRPLSETIGQWSYVKPYWDRILLNVDTTFKDYVFWDALRRGTAPGFQISGPAFCLPTAQTITSYAFGKGMSASLVEAAIPSNTSVRENGKPTQNIRNARQTSLTMPKAKPNPGSGSNVAWTNAQIRNMLERNQGFLASTTVDELCLGNQYAICNPDCTFSVASPETVTVEYSASDYRRPIRFIIKTKMEKATVEDVYTDEKRVVTIKYYDAERGTQVYEYENLIGRIPIVHLANERSANEIFGRPIYEGQLPLMQQYDDLLFNMLEGVKLLATPIPTFEGLDNPTETKQLNSDQRQYTDELGNTKTEWITRFDRQAGLYIGKGGSAKMLSTQVGFTKDSLDAIRQCFLLYLNGVRIPEMIWGGAISSSKASADAQMPPFITYIQFRRLMLEGQGADPALGIEARGGFLELIDIWLRTYKLLNPSIVVGPVQIEWPEIDLVNDQVKYMWATYLNGAGKISDESVVKLSGYFPDPAAEVAKAAGQRARQPKFDSYDAKLRRAKLEAERASLQPPDDNGPPFSTDYVTPWIDIQDSENAEQEYITPEYSINGPLWIDHLISGGY